MQDLDKARSIAHRSIVESDQLNPIADWWSGTSIESAWQALHLAQEQLVMLEGEASLKTQAPYLMMLASIVYEPMHATEETKQLTSSAPDPRTAKQILVSYHARSDATHQAARNLRNIYLTLAVFIAAMDIVLTLAKVTSGAVVGLGTLAGGLSVVFALQSGTPKSPYNI